MCFFVDRLKKHSFQRIIAVCFIAIVLCFGYTTGTDWKNYELMYKNPSIWTHFRDMEIGFLLLVKCFQYITSDFWVFSGFCKIFYLGSLIYLVSQLSSKPWSVVAFSLVFSTLFLIIDCPMRFMLGMAFFCIGAGLFFKKQYFKSFIFGTLSLFFHVTMIIPLFIFLSYPLYKKIYELNKIQLVILICLTIIVSMNVWLYRFIFNNVLSILNLAEFKNSYGFIVQGSLLNLGFIRNLLLCFMIIFYKDLFRSIKYGQQIFYFAILFFLLEILLRPIPTAFRLGLFYSHFVCIAITALLFNNEHVYMKKYLQVGTCFLFTIILLRSVYGSYIYYPYTNSIPYLLKGHMSYYERLNYNRKIFIRDFGKIEEHDTGDAIADW